MIFGWRDYDTFTGRWTAPDPMGDKGGDKDWYGYCLDAPVNGVDPLGLWKDEHGNEIRKGRLITDYVPGIDMAFSGYGTSKKVRNELRGRKSNYSDENDWGIKYELENEARDYSLWKGIWDTVTSDTDEEIFDRRERKAKLRIGK